MEKDRHAPENFTFSRKDTQAKQQWKSAENPFKSAFQAMRQQAQQAAQFEAISDDVDKREPSTKSVVSINESRSEHEKSASPNKKSSD
jgi:hypothetical protein